MNSSARDNYLQTEVLTATPQKLQLMLIEAAIRFAGQAREHWNAQRDDAASEAIIRCQQIMAQLLGGVKPERHPELARRAAGVYAFIFNCFVAAHLNRDEKLLADAVSVLAIEQETWRQVCDKLGSRRDEAAGESGSVTFEA